MAYPTSTAGPLQVLNMNKTSFSYANPDIYACRLHVRASDQQHVAARELPPVSRKGGRLAAQRLVSNAASSQEPMPMRDKRARPGLYVPLPARTYLMAGGTKVIPRPVDQAACAQRQADFTQKHLDDTDALLKELAPQWEPKASDTKALRAELRPNRDHLFAGSRIPLARPVAPQPANAEPATRNGNRTPGITKSPKGGQPRLRTEVDTSPQAKPQSKNG